MEQQNETNIVTRALLFFKKIGLANLEATSARIFLTIVFLLPIFALPFGIFPVDFSKAMFSYVGISLIVLLVVLMGIKRGSILIPKSIILLGLFLIPLAYFVSALFSGNIKLSLIGAGYEVGTFTSFLFLALIALLVPLLFRTINHVALIYKTVFLSAMVLFVAQLFHTGLGMPIPPWAIFQGKIASLLGSWSDVGIFFGLVALLALSSIELRGERRRARTFLWVVLGMSLIAVFFVNSLTLQYVFGFFVLALLVDRLMKLSRSGESYQASKQIFRDPSFFVFLAIVVFTVAHGMISVLVNYLGLQFPQVILNWSGTFEVVKGALAGNPILGSGPNTFSYDWLMFRPDPLSANAYWNTRFLSGVGLLPGAVGEIGILGAAMVITFLSSVLFAGKKVLSYKEHNLERMLLVSSFLGAAYLWTFTVVYTPGFLLYIFTGLFTGVFIAALGFTKEAAFLEFKFAKNTKRGIVIYVVAGAMLSASVCSIVIFSTKSFAGYYYTTALKEASINTDITKAAESLGRATLLDPQDVYFRSSAEVGLMKLGQLINAANNETNPSDDEKAQFHNVLTLTIQNANNATVVNPHEPENWMELGRVFEALLQVDPKNFKDPAITAYKKAFSVSPKNPTALLSLARVEEQTGNTAGALEYIKVSLDLKNDYTDAYILAANIAASKGDFADAIAGLDRAVVTNPSNPDNVYIILRIGSLYYQEGSVAKSQSIFEKLVETNPNYVDARYSLGLVYDKEGMTTKAIEQFESINLLVPGNSQVQAILSNLRSGRSALGGPTTPSSSVVTPTKTSPKKK